MTKYRFAVKINTVVGLVAQLDRAFDYESKGRRFESCRGHHFEIDIARDCGVFCFSDKKSFVYKKRTGCMTGSNQSNNKALTPKAAPDTANALSGVFSCDIYKYEYA